jgi:hypothetical protein
MKSKLILLAVLSLAPFSSYAVTYGLGEGAFAGFTTEKFQGPLTVVGGGGTYDFGTGLIYQDVSGGAFVNYTGTFGMGTNPDIFAGRDGSGDGYLGTYDTPATFRLNFAGGVNFFGFSGAESAVEDESFGRNGFLSINFFDSGANLLGSFNIDTNGPHAWTQWHGFSSGTAIHSVEFNTVGHSVFDDVKFQAGGVGVPDSGSVMTLLGVALIALAAVRRRLAV